MIEKQEHTVPEDEHHFARRDAETQTMLGLFVGIMSLPVLVGTAFAEKPAAMIVNGVAGLVLLGVGVGLASWGIRARRRLPD